MLLRIQAVVIDQRCVRPCRQQSLHHGRVALHGGQHQGCAACRIGGIEGRALLEQTLHLGQVARAGRVLQCTSQSGYA